MSNVTNARASGRDESAEWRLSVNLAAAFRLAAELGWHEAVANHFSLALAPDGKRFLMNPRWRHFARIKASELLLLDAEDRETMSRPDAPGHVRLVHPWPPPRPRCPTRAASSTSPAIRHGDRHAGRSRDQADRANTARCYDRVAIDLGTGDRGQRRGGRRLVRMPRQRRRSCWGTTASWSVGDTVAEAFDDLYYLSARARCWPWPTRPARSSTSCPPRSPRHRPRLGAVQGRGVRPLRGAEAEPRRQGPLLPRLSEGYRGAGQRGPRPPGDAPRRDPR